MPQKRNYDVICSFRRLRFRRFIQRSTLRCEAAKTHASGKQSEYDFARSGRDDEKAQNDDGGFCIDSE